MYRPTAFAVDDRVWLHAAIRAYPFATIVVPMDGRIEFAYAPVILDAQGGSLGTLRFHLARTNIVARADGKQMFFSFKGPDAYVSPDWYETKMLVPTWNYIAIEAKGIARRLHGDDLRQLLADLSEVQESQLRPKAPWTMEKVPQERLSALSTAIVGLEVPLETLEGKFKLSQDKKPDDVKGVIAGLEGRGTPGAQAVAAAMREISVKTAS